jgi:4-alpha-glucanotransferase
MERLAGWLPENDKDFRRFVKENPLAADYARFRAAMEKQRAVWRAWPARLRDGDLREGDYAEEIKQYHLYAQWLARRQVEGLAAKARQRGTALYFDLPVGVHPDGYDVWRHRGIFTGGVSAGAPPDPVFTGGQDWGFPPLHPEKVRAQGYRYVREYLGHHLRYAGMLRLDHVMGLHRLYWVPRGLPPTEGVYVRYRPEELYSIMALESHRHRSVIVGEDLGIVPGYVRPAMARHGLHRLYILGYELADSAARTPRQVPRRSVAALNTHDMHPFASFWDGADIRENRKLGLLTEGEASEEGRSREATKNALAAFLRSKGLLAKDGKGPFTALKACLAFLAGSAAHTVLVNIEDLWLETRPQNVPGTGDKFPSWRRKARYTLEEFIRRNDVRDILREIRKMR